MSQKGFRSHGAVDRRAQLKASSLYWRRAYHRCFSSIRYWPLFLLLSFLVLLWRPAFLFGGYREDSPLGKEPARRFVINPNRTTFTRKTQTGESKDPIGYKKQRRAARKKADPKAINLAAEQAYEKGKAALAELDEEIQRIEKLKREGKAVVHPWDVPGSRGRKKTAGGEEEGGEEDEEGEGVGEGAKKTCSKWMQYSGRQLKEVKGTVPLPCGMSLDSAVTIVGLVPWRGNQPAAAAAAAARALKPSEKLEVIVEVHGPAELEGDKSVIYHASVRPKGDWSGKQVIEQNSCYRGRWGDAIRCEGTLSLSHEETVDELPRCERWTTPQVVAAVGASAKSASLSQSLGRGGILEEPSRRQGLELGMGLEKSLLLGDSSVKTVSGTGLGGGGGGGGGESRRGAGGAAVAGSQAKEDVIDLEWPFPVQPNVQFVMILRAGRQGFHLSVDGSHICSFPYRSGNPLQEAGAVRFAGTLAVHSVFFTGLPTAPPSFQSLLTAAEVLKAIPQRPLGVPISLFIGVLSTANHFSERAAVRESWMQHPLIRTGDVVPRFFLALHNNVQINLEVSKEADMYGDVIVLPFIDRYDLLVLKTVAICKYAIHNVTTPYIMKVDDDNFVRLDAVMEEVERSGFTRGLYMGSINEFHKPLRDGKWAVTEEEWPETNYPPYANGPGYIITQDIAAFIDMMDSRGSLRLFKMEDVSMGMWVVQYGINNTIHYVHNWRFCHTGCMEDYVTAHYQSPLQMICLWKKLARGLVTCC